MKNGVTDTGTSHKKLQIRLKVNSNCNTVANNQNKSQI